MGQRLPPQAMSGLRSQLAFAHLLCNTLFLCIAYNAAMQAHVFPHAFTVAHVLRTCFVWEYDLVGRSRPFSVEALKYLGLLPALQAFTTNCWFSSPMEECFLFLACLVILAVSCSGSLYNCSASGLASGFTHGNHNGFVSGLQQLG